jgi:hypothetical protein
MLALSSVCMKADMRRVRSRPVVRDMSSADSLARLAVIPATFIDLRRKEAHVKGRICRAGDMREIKNT